MQQSLITIAYIAASALFILSLGGLSQQETARRGNVYGIVTFGTKDLKWVVDYIKNQKEHHRKGTIHERLERIASDDAKAAVEGR